MTNDEAAGKSRPAQAKPVLLAGGNPQIAKADGDAPVQAYIAAMPGWKRDVGPQPRRPHRAHRSQRQKAVKWNSPFYGIEGQGWFLGFHCFTKYVKVAFFRGTSLSPIPPGESKRRTPATSTSTRTTSSTEKLLASWISRVGSCPAGSRKRRTERRLAELSRTGWGRSSSTRTATATPRPA